MNIKTIYKRQVLGKSSGNLILFVDEKINVQNLRKYTSSSEFSFIQDLIKIKDDKKRFYHSILAPKKKLF